MGATEPPLPMARVLQVPGLWYVNAGCQDREHFKPKSKKENLSISNKDAKNDGKNTGSVDTERVQVLLSSDSK